MSAVALFVGTMCAVAAFEVHRRRADRSTENQQDGAAPAFREMRYRSEKPFENRRNRVSSRLFDSKRPLARREP